MENNTPEQKPISMGISEHIKQKIEDKAIEESCSPSDYEYLKKYYAFGYSLAQQEIKERDETIAEYKEECNRLDGLVKFWQEKYYGVVPPAFTPPKIDNL